MKGKVYLVGAGPGDPELLTLKALRLLRTAEAVLHDDLVAPEILDLIPSTARIFNVGKRCKKRKIQQSEINRLMVALATSGLSVVRLKGGDPLIFGRAGEEIESLRINNIAFEIIPGVTSVLGAAAAAQIPLTDRRASSALVLITAHRASEHQASEHRASEHQASEHRPSERRSSEKRALEQDASEWSNLVASGATLVIYMPGPDYAYIARRLTASGVPAETPCVLISRATTKYQRTHRTTVLDLNRAPQLASPTLLVVGEVVRSADRAEVVEEFVMPELSPANDSLLPVALFKTTPLAGFPPVSG